MNQTSEYKSASVAQFIPIISGHSSTKRALLSISLLFAISFHLLAQDTTLRITTQDTISNNLPVNLLLIRSPSGKDRMGLSRIKIVAATNIIGYSAAMVGLNAAWYKNYPKSKFHFFKDGKEWKQVDKIGHALSAYAESKASMEIWRWTGINRKKRIWIGGMSGAFYQTVIETLDGFSSQWGWSWGDFGTNIIGSGMLVAQELAWDDQRIQFKFSFHRKMYSDAILNQRCNELFGKSTAERFLKDYNGQTYWLSTNIKSFFSNSKFPAWLQLAVGTGAEGLFGAKENISRDDNGNILFNRTNIKRYRQWYLAPDIDFTKIKTNKKGLKLALRLLSFVKFPLPSLEYGNGKFKLNAITF